VNIDQVQTGWFDLLINSVSIDGLSKTDHLIMISSNQ